MHNTFRMATTYTGRDQYYEQARQGSPGDGTCTARQLPLGQGVRTITCEDTILQLAWPHFSIIVVTRSVPHTQARDSKVQSLKQL